MTLARFRRHYVAHPIYQDDLRCVQVDAYGAHYECAICAAEHLSFEKHWAYRRWVSSASKRLSNVLTCPARLRVNACWYLEGNTRQPLRAHAIVIVDIIRTCDMEERAFRALIARFAETPISTAEEGFRLCTEQGCPQDYIERVLPTDEAQRFRGMLAHMRAESRRRGQFRHEVFDTMEVTR